MSRSRDEITPSEVREIMAAGEDITRRFLGEVLDVVADTATERAARWVESEEAIRNLRRLRQAINDGEELTYAVIDFWISVLPDPDHRTVRLSVTDAEYAALGTLGKALGTTPEGYATMLAQQSCREHLRAEAVKGRGRKALILAVTREQGDNFLMTNATAFTGWQVTVHDRSRAGVDKLRGQTYEMSVILERPDDTDRMNHRDLNIVATITRAGKQPTVVTVDPAEPFGPADVLGREEGA